MFQRRPPEPKEEVGIVLDFLQHGHSNSRERTPVLQVLGKKYLTILEVVPKKGLHISPGDEVYIGPEKRDKVHHVAGRIIFEKLSETAKLELEKLIAQVVESNEEKFVEFFNKCGPVSMRLHKLEILPGIGKKHMWDIIDERKEKPFESFEEIKSRVKLVPDPKQTVTRRIMDELKNKDKYNLFVGNPSFSIEI